MSTVAPAKGFSFTVTDSGHGKWGWIRKKEYNRIEERSARIEDLLDEKIMYTSISGELVDFTDRDPAPTGVSQSTWKTKYPYWQEAIDMFIMRRCIQYLTLYQRCATSTTSNIIDISEVGADLGDITYLITQDTEKTAISSGFGGDGTISWILDSLELNDEGNGYSNISFTLKTYGYWTPVMIYEDTP